MTLTIEEGIGQLDRALEALGAQLPQAGEPARQAAERIRGRIQVGADKTVVALAGATGSGKSSLVNCLAGKDVAQVAPVRPTTRHALAVSGMPADRVLDWIGVGSRVVGPEVLGDEDIVLVDLPDFDSVEHEHRRIADAIIDRADVVVFVLDPQKYADAVIHKDYLQSFVERGAVSVVAFNQIDRVGADEREALLANLAELLAGDGLEVPVVATSTATGEGLEELSQLLLRLVQERQAVRLALAADLRSEGARLAYAARSEGGKTSLGGGASWGGGAGSWGTGAVAVDKAGVGGAVGADDDAGLGGQVGAGGGAGLADDGGGLGQSGPASQAGSSRQASFVGEGPMPEFEPVAAAIAQAAGAEDVARAAEQSYLVRAAKATSWPPARLFKRGVDPLVRLGLVSQSTGQQREGRASNMMAGSAAVARSAVADFATASLDALPESWRKDVALDVDAATSELVESADALMAGVDLEHRRRPLWWRLVGLCHGLFFIFAIAGIGWLAALAAGQWLRIRLPEPSYLGPLSIPALLAIGGLALGWALSTLARRWRVRSAARLRSRVRGRLIAGIGERAKQSIQVPLQRERSRYGQFMECVGRLATVR